MPHGLAAILAAVALSSTAPERAYEMPDAEVQLYSPYSRNAPADLGMLRLSTRQASFEKLHGAMRLKYLRTQAAGPANAAPGASVEVYEVTNAASFKRSNPRAAPYSSARWLTVHVIGVSLVSIGFCEAPPKAAECSNANYLAL